MPALVDGPEDASDRAGSVTVTLDATDVGSRVDRAVVAALARAGHQVSRSQLARAFDRGEVVCDGIPLTPGAALKEALEVEVVLPVPEPLAAFPEPLELRVVHDDAALVVIDKRAGMPVHAGPGHPSGTLVNAVLHHLGAQADELPVLPGNEDYRPGLVHRLDKDTSGLIVVAKHLRALEHLAAQFREHSIERSYLGIVRGEPSFTHLRVETTHARDPADRRRFAPETAGAKRQATTTMEIVERLEGAALVRFVLETGRTHQIRMHARHVGHPLLGDELYGSTPRSEGLRALSRQLGRQALHAAVLGFLHPDGETMRFECAPPEDMQAALRALRG